MEAEELKELLAALKKQDDDSLAGWAEELYHDDKELESLCDILRIAMHNLIEHLKEKVKKS